MRLPAPRCKSVEGYVEGKVAAAHASTLVLLHAEMASIQAHALSAAGGYHQARLGNCWQCKLQLNHETGTVT